MKISRRDDGNSEQTSLMIPEPFEGVFSLRDAMNRLFDESIWNPFGVLDKRGGRCPMGGIMPRVDLSETDNEIKLRAAIPGVDPDKLNVEVTEDSISLSGKIERSEEEKKENFYRTECYVGEFSREFALPCKIDPEKVDAKAKNGVITITLQKQVSEQKKKVQVRLDKQ